MGSGPGGSLTCANDAPPAHVYAYDLRSARIIYLNAGRLTVTDGGVIAASRTHQDYRQAYAGGSVMVRGDVIDFSAGTVTARGGGTDSMFGEPTHPAGDGYVSIHYRTSLTGTSTPAAFTTQVRADGEGLATRRHWRQHAACAPAASR